MFGWIPTVVVVSTDPVTQGALGIVIATICGFFLPETTVMGWP